jgi:hypothetical protein
LFEEITTRSPAAKFRAAATVPIGAFLIAQAYYTLYPLLGHVPAAMFYAIAAILCAGTFGGAIGIVRVLRRHEDELNTSAIAWLLATLLATLLCAWLSLSLIVPWFL